MLCKTLFAVTALIASVAADGNIVVPYIREPGPAFKANCGEKAFDLVSKDPAGPQQHLIAEAPTDPTHMPQSCNFNLCNGIPFNDNKDQVMKYRPGMQLSVQYNITVPHAGHANMSVVDTKTNTVIGKPLKVFEKFGEKKDNKDELDWSFKMSDTGKKCAKPGSCVLQFWWHSDEAKQTFASCVDFVQ